MEGKSAAASLGTPSAGADLGPLPGRSAAGLRWQFCVQPLFFVAYICVIAVALVLQGPGSPGELDLPKRWFIDGRRYRLERRGTAEEWTAWTSRVVAEYTHEAEARERRGRARKRWVARVPRVELSVRDYRGVGAAAVAAAAAEHGWAVDWKASLKPHRSLTWVCVKELASPDSPRPAS
jgi:hypothetical protein